MISSSKKGYTMTGKQAELQGREGVIFALILFDLERG